LAGGYDYNPVKFKITGDKGEFEKLYQREKKKATGSTSQVKSNMTMFESGKFGSSPLKATNTDADTERHANPIISMRPFKSVAGNISMFSTSDINGVLYFWPI